MLIIAYLTLFVALTISGTAIFYSVTGLTAIFAAAVTPIVVMGTALEVAKLIAAVWLHRHWHEAPVYLRAYLSFAVVVLMFITSLGIFGFLSKAHIEQTSASGAQAAKLERIESDIARQEALIDRTQQQLADQRAAATASTAGAADRISQIRQEIDDIRARADKRVADQQAVIAEAAARVQDKLTPHRKEMGQIDQQVAQLDSVIQGLIEMDYLSRAQKRQGEQQAERNRLAAARAEVLQRMNEIRNAPRPEAERARARIEQIRADEAEAVESQRALIRQLAAPAAQASGDADDAQGSTQARQRIEEARAQIAALSDRKFDIQAELRKLEAEVGPLKYIAAFLYGEQADKATLEEAVRWVIVVIIVVFDPLAVLLLIASQWSFMQHAAQRRAGAAPPSTPASASGARGVDVEPRNATRTAIRTSAPTDGTSRPRDASAGDAGAKARAPAPPPSPPPSPPTASHAADATDVGSPDATAVPGHGIGTEPMAETHTDPLSGADDPARLKQALLDRARAGQRKPSERAKKPEEQAMAEALPRFTDPLRETYDRDFTQQLRTIAPASWIGARKSS